MAERNATLRRLREEEVKRLRRASAHRLQSKYLLLWAALAVLPGCRSERSPKVLSAYLIEGQKPDGIAQAGETIRIRLDRPLPQGFKLDAMRLFSAPPRTQLLVRVLPQPSPHLLDFELLSTPPALHIEGSYGKREAREGDPTGIGVDLGLDGSGEEWVDLQQDRTFPVLLEAIWEDRPVEGAASGDLVVDQGDWIHLVFDREVALSGALRPESRAGEGEIGAENRASPPASVGPGLALVPADIILTSRDDRLDDGEIRSTFAEGRGPREVLLVLGSNPRLTIAGRREAAAAGQEGGPAPSIRLSGIAVNGTPVQPMMKIVDRRGWPGVISREAVDIEFPSGYFSFEKRGDMEFPPPGHRFHHTVTAIAGGRALIAGGRTWGGKAIDQVLLFSPGSSHPIAPVGEMEEPRYLHSAGLLPGDDGLPGTSDDLIILAGGTDGTRTLESLSAARLDPSFPDRISVQTVEGKLKWPRMYHASASIPPGLLLLDGGQYSMLSGGRGLVASVELLSFESREGKGSVRKRWDFPTLPRMRHSATYLGRGPDGGHYVLIYGGIGVPRSQGGDLAQPPAGAEKNVALHFEGDVLASPVLLRIIGGRPRGKVGPEDPGSPDADPEVQEIPLDFDFRFEMLRYDHRAVPVNFEPWTVDPGSLREVLIVGGSLRPPNFNPDLSEKRLFEIPRFRRPEEVDLWIRGPLYTENSAALVFEFNPSSPRESRFRIVGSSTGDQRVHFALAAVADLGILILGGENPQKPEEIFMTSEVYLPRSHRLEPLAVPLSAARTRFAAIVVEGPEGRTVYAVGGSSPQSDGQDFADIERLRLEGR